MIIRGFVKGEKNVCGLLKSAPFSFLYNFYFPREVNTKIRVEKVTQTRSEKEVIRELTWVSSVICVCLYITGENFIGRTTHRQNEFHVHVQYLLGAFVTTWRTPKLYLLPYIHVWDMGLYTTYKNTHNKSNGV